VNLAETRYARSSGDVSIAYQVVGEGPFDVVVVQGFVTHVELAWTVPFPRDLRRRLASFARLIVFDKRGTGMSDPVSGAPSLETRMDDLRAVMDAASSERAAIVGISEGVPMSLLFTATYPERTAALVLMGGFPRTMWAPDYPWGWTEERYREEHEADMKMFGPRDVAVSAVQEVFGQGTASWIDYWRNSASPAMVTALNRLDAEIDVRGVLTAIRVPTLLVHGDNDHVPIEGARYMADRIPGARLIELAGARHVPEGDDFERFCDETERFLTGVHEEGGWNDAEAETVLATVLFTDIVASTETMAALGDRGWRDVLERHHAAIRRELSRFRGNEIDTAGDGFFASFDGPARAIRCACAIIESMQEVGLEVRVGLHTGECEVVEGKVAGIAVSIGARVSGQATPGEVLVSQTVKDLVAGSGLVFEERGVAELKGVPGEWRLYAVADAAARTSTAADAAGS
jgi:class 3 adenylate cyclase/alpha-beta hydrolase superfamily lysophospholipase